MNNKIFLAMIIIGAIAAVGYFKFDKHNTAPTGDGAHHAEAKKEVDGDEYERGPHRGRMLRRDDFALEMTIFEDNVPPEYHVYAFKDDKPMKPEGVTLTVTLNRLDGEVNTFNFAPIDDYLKGDGVVTEPHSFDVEVKAVHDGKSYEWKYPSYEGRIQIPDDIAKASGIETEKAGAAVVQNNAHLPGKIALNGNTIANVRARFPGIVRTVKKGIGETVMAGEVLATVESNDSLQVYEVKSPSKGIILSRNTNVGDVAGETPLFKIADLSTVWAELHVFPSDMLRVQPGQSVEVTSLEGKRTATGTIGSLLPMAEDATQTIIARILLDNPEGAWRAGMTVQGKVAVATREVPLAVKSSGLQRFRDFTVVFAKVNDTYEVRMLELGQDDGVNVEVLEGIKPGTEYVSGNSFLIRADIEKSGASHDH